MSARGYYYVGLVTRTDRGLPIDSRHVYHTNVPHITGMAFGVTATAARHLAEAAFRFKYSRALAQKAKKRKAKSITRSVSDIHE